MFGFLIVDIVSEADRDLSGHIRSIGKMQRPDNPTATQQILANVMQTYEHHIRSEGVVAERRIFFLGALPGRSGRLPPFLRPYVRPASVPRLGALSGVIMPGAATKWAPTRTKFE